MIAVRIPRAVKIVVMVFLAYLALMLLVAMPALNLLAPKIYREQTGRELKLGRIILLNPFTLALSVRNASSANADGSPFWSFELLRADVSLASIWRLHLVLDEVRLDGLAVQIDQKNAERYNFSDILDYRAKHYPAAAEGDNAPATASSSPAITIDKLHFSATHLGLRAPYLSEPLVLELNDLAIALSDLTTNADKHAKPEQAPALRSGAIDIALKKIGVQFLREQQPFATQLNNLHLSAAALATDATQEQPLSLSANDASGGNIDIKTAVALGAKSSSGSASVRNVNLVPAWQYLSPKLAFTAQSAALDGDLQFSVNWRESLRYALRNSRINLHDVALQSKTDNNSSVALAALQLDGITVDSTQPRAQVATIALHEPVVKGWNRDTQVSLLDMFKVAGNDEESTTPPWQVQIGEFQVQGGAIHWQASQLPDLPLTIAPLNVTVSHLQFPGAEPLQLQLNTAVNDAANIALQGELVPADISGKLVADVSGLPVAWANTLLAQQMRATLTSGRLSTRTQLMLEKSQPLTLQSEGRIDQLELQSMPDKRKLLAWKQLQWQQLALDLRAQKLQLKKIAIDQPWAQFRINADGTNNFQQLLIEQKPAPKQPAQKPWQLAVDNVHIEKALLDFRDNSLSRTFHTNIADFTGDITGISNRGKEKAKAALKGSVDGYAPVALSGTISPFAAPPAMNLALDLTNLDLATFTPYSGTYAGYVIDSGRLNVQLVYTLEDNRIKGTNHIVVNQLQLGKQVSGPKVMDLPLRFAIYLLTDSNGVMDLGVDVTGSVDDPDFSVGSIIWKAFRNLIVKTVTSPFRALANLVGGSDQDDMDRVEFSAGSDQIAAAHNEKLRTLVTALEKKPELKLGITGHVSPSQDIEALGDNELSEQLIAQGGITRTDIQQQSTSWQREVTKLFGKRFPDRKSESLTTMQMNDVMRDNIELPASALQELADRRALAVKQILITELGLPADRAFVKPADLGSDKNPGLHATMEVN